MGYRQPLHGGLDQLGRWHPPGHHHRHHQLHRRQPREHDRPLHRQRQPHLRRGGNLHHQRDHRPRGRVYHTEQHGHGLRPGGDRHGRAGQRRGVRALALGGGGRDVHRPGRGRTEPLCDRPDLQPLHGGLDQLGRWHPPGHHQRRHQLQRQPGQHDGPLHRQRQPHLRQRGYLHDNHRYRPRDGAADYGNEHRYCQGRPRPPPARPHG